MFGEDFRTKQRQPRAEAIIYSADLEELQATFYLLSLQIRESLNPQQDMVMLNLAPRADITRFEGQPEYNEPDIDGMLGWADLIEPNDLVVVKLYDAALNWIEGGEGDNTHLQYYGVYLVDRVSVRMAYTAGSKVQRVISIQGRSFGKLFTEHTLARFPALAGALGNPIDPKTTEETKEAYRERYRTWVKEQRDLIESFGVVPSIVGDLTYTLYLAGQEGLMYGPMPKVLRNLLSPPKDVGEDWSIPDGVPLIFGNAFMKLRYGFTTDKDGEQVRDHIELNEMLDLTSNIHAREGWSIYIVDATGVQGQEQGPILGVLRAIAAPPFYEIFVQTVPQKDADLKVKAYLCVRSCPFDSIATGEKDYTPESTLRYEVYEKGKREALFPGQLIYQPFWYIDENNVPTENNGEGEPRIHKVDSWEIINSDLGRSDSDTFSFFSASPSSGIIDWGPIIDSIIPGFYPGPYPDFSGGGTNAELEAWREVHRQIQDRDGPNKLAGTALLRSSLHSDVGSRLQEVRQEFDGATDMGMGHRFGVKLMQVQNKFMPEEIDYNGEELTEEQQAEAEKLGVDALFKQTKLIADWFSMNPHYISGKLVIAGRSDIWKGNWIEVNLSASGRSDQELGDEERRVTKRLRLYVEQVEQSWQFGGNWITTLTVTRGEYII